MTDLARRDRAELDDFRDRFAVWMGEHRTELEPMRSLPSELDAQFGVQRRFQRELYEAGWLRRGWPESVGGLGGSVAIRGALAEELTRAGYVFPLALSMIEVLAPAVLRFGDPGLAAQMFPRFSPVWSSGVRVSPSRRREAISGRCVRKPRATAISGG